MRIMIIIHDLAGAGAQRSAVNLANGFAEHGCSVALVALTAGGPMAAEVSSAVDLRILESRRVASSLKRLRNAVEAFKPDVMLATPRHVALVTCVAHKRYRWDMPLFVREAEALSAAQRATKNPRIRIQHLLLPMLYTRASGVVVISHGMKSEMESRLPDSMRNRVAAIHNPALQPHKEVHVRTRLRIFLQGERLTHRLGPHNQGAWRLVAVGRLHPQKGFDVLVEALARVVQRQPRITLDIYGEGPERPRLERDIQRLGLARTVRLCGWHPDPFQTAGDADMFILSSRWEGFGNVVVEALAEGLPCVVTDCEFGPSEIISSASVGLVTRTSDPEDLAEKICQGLQNYDTFDLASILKRALDFTAEQKCLEYIECFNAAR